VAVTVAARRPRLRREKIVSADRHGRATAGQPILGDRHPVNEGIRDPVVADHLPPPPFKDYDE
jgi:hypothetical protein